MEFQAIRRMVGTYADMENGEYVVIRRGEYQPGRHETYDTFAQACHRAERLDLALTEGKQVVWAPASGVWVVTRPVSRIATLVLTGPEADALAIRWDGWNRDALGHLAEWEQATPADGYTVEDLAKHRAHWKSVVCALAKVQYAANEIRAEEARRNG